MAAAFLVMITAGAQAQVRSGAAPVVDVESPMELEIDFPVTDPSMWGGDWIAVTTDTSRYRCDGVTVSDVKFRAHKPRRGTVQIDTSAKVSNKPGSDRFVTLVFLAVSGDGSKSPLGSSPKREVEERETVNVETRVFVLEKRLIEISSKAVLLVKVN